jgi:hypothetical protein
MDPTNKKKGASPHYSLYQRDVFKRGGEHGQRTFCSTPGALSGSLMRRSAVVLGAPGSARGLDALEAK